MRKPDDGLTKYQRHYRKYPERRKEANRKWREKNPERNRERVKKWRLGHPEQHRQHCSEYSRKKIGVLRSEIFQILGRKCSNPTCPVPPKKMDLKALQIDHVNGGGTQARKHCCNSIKYFSQILDEVQKGSKNYQVLCAYCNWMKRFEVTFS
jgi:hypothetical protein